MSELSANQISKLRNGHTITLKHGQIVNTLDIPKLSEQNQKKLTNAYHKGKSVRIALNADEITGQGFKLGGSGFAKKTGGALIGKHTFDGLRKAVKKSTGISDKQAYALGRVAEQGAKASTKASLGMAGSAVLGYYGGPVGAIAGKAMGEKGGEELNKAIWGKGIPSHAVTFQPVDSNMLNPLHPAITQLSKFVERPIGYRGA